MSSFLNNGGYVVKKETCYPFGNNIRYMDCKRCGEQVRNVGENASSVVCPECLMGKVVKMFPETATYEPKSYKPTGRPAGWHWMNEFVDKDGNVFHKGKEVPELKGKLKPTKVKPPNKKKSKRRSREQILVAKHKEKLAAQRKQKRELAKELKKQQDFLNHKTEDK